MKKKFTIFIVLALIVAMTGAITAGAYATGSIGDLPDFNYGDGGKDKTKDNNNGSSNNGTNGSSSYSDNGTSNGTSNSSSNGSNGSSGSSSANNFEFVAGNQVLDSDLVIDEANPTEYMKTDEDGNLVPTTSSRLVGKAKRNIFETGTNGKEIITEIPTVTEVLKIADEDADKTCQEDVGVSTDDLDQLTYFLDIKYLINLQRVRWADKSGYKVKDGTVTLDFRDGITGLTKYVETLRATDPEDIIIAQYWPGRKKLYFFHPISINKKTGTLKAKFPCSGPLMICQVMDRSDE